MTIEQRLAETGGVTSGWNYLRISLAASVLGFHSLLTSYGIDGNDGVWHSPYRASIAVILPAFFALGGFLVSESLVRAKSLVEYLVHRAARILPALFVEILLSSTFLGALLTALPIGVYLSRPAFWRYFLNVIGWIHFYLPGVFWRTPLPFVVNGSLWTIPYEFAVYGSLALIALIGLTKRRLLLLALTLAANAAFAGSYAATYVETRAELLPGGLVILSFYAAVCLHLFRDRVVLSRSLFAGSALTGIVLLSFPQTEFLAAFPVAYATIYLGLTSARKVWLVRSGDYSYGLYLFAFPIQQTYAELFPGMRYWWANLVCSVVLAMTCAFFSWHCVEKHVQKRRPQMVAAVNRWFAIAGSGPLAQAQAEVGAATRQS